MKNLISILYILAFSPILLFSNQKDSLKVIPNLEYSASSTKRVLMGDTWRDIWTHELEIEILDLDNFKGGLTPIRVGGGMQTQSLRFQAGNGEVYKFRGIKKTTDRMLDKELLETFVDDILDDIFSTSNPLAAIISSPIIESVGVLQAKPRLVVLPDHPILENGYETYIHMLGTLEIHPDIGGGKGKGFADADNVYGTYKLFKKWRDNNKFQVDQIEFCKARLLDVFMGDWDRHYDQWRWAEYEIGDTKYCRPIPRDRDQAYCHYDGMIPFLADFAIVQIENCGEDFPFIEDLTWSGRYLDRKFLQKVSRHEWDSLTNHIIESVNDSVINHAVNVIPKELKEQREYLRHIINSRKKLFPEAAEDYYEMINEYIDIHCSDKDEYAKIERLNDNEVEVKIYDLNKKGKKEDNPFFSRIFSCEDTKEIRLYLHGGDDEVKIEGKVDDSILLRIIGGKGEDKYKDKSKVKGWLFGILPFAEVNRDYTYIYDSHKSKIKDSPSTYIDDSKYKLPKNDTLVFEPPVRDWGEKWWYAPPLISLSPDEGIMIGSGPMYTKYDFRADPYLLKHYLSAGYSFMTNKAKAKYYINLPELADPFDFELDLYFSQLDILNYYGYGNELDLFNPDDENDYYDIRHYMLEINTKFSFDISDDIKLSFGPGFSFMKTNTSDSTYLRDNPVFGTADIASLNLFGNFEINKRNSAFNPKEGYYLLAEAEHIPQLLNIDEAYTKLGLDLRGYFTADLFTEMTFAARTKLKAVSGKVPFYDFAYLGGYESLRGYNTQRFAGDASVLFNVESRIHLSTFKMILPGKLGMILFSDLGRVFVDGENSEKWYNSFGGGFSISVVEDEYLISIYAAKSPEKWGFYVHYGFMF